MAQQRTTAFDRGSEDVARRFIEERLPDPDGRRASLELMAHYIRTAHRLNPATWNITIRKDQSLIRLNIGFQEAFVVRWGGRVYFFVETDALTDHDKQELARVAQVERHRHGRTMVDMSHVDILRVAEIVKRVSIPAIERGIHRPGSRTTWHESHSPGVLKFMRNIVGIDVPDPGYVAGTDGGVQFFSTQSHSGTNDLESLGMAFHAVGLHYTPWQIATFYTALQTKGFVILSGTSGTGKTKIVQRFAHLLPRPTAAPVVPASESVVTVQPYMLKYSRFIVPKRVMQQLAIPFAGDSQDIDFYFDDQRQQCRLYIYPDGSTAVMLLRGPARRWFSEQFKLGDRFILDPQLDAEQGLAGFRLIGEADWAVVDAEPSDTIGDTSNTLFLSVRPDWRDSKSLMGYYNPLTGSYDWTGFLRFLLRAKQSYDNRDGLAWFVVLDEMNLAHVEYYFADLLSVLESGRDPHGMTNEPLRIAYPDTLEAEGDLPPREVKLPPNLYIVGTVNIDETTHAFSPKVLDRAFSIELVDVDFTNYPPVPMPGDIALADDARQRLLTAFTRNGRFARIEKDTIAAYIDAHPHVRDRLQRLNSRLRPHNLHFGYRVFDEIVTFLAAADDNGMFSEIGSPDPAFDAAVLMKVLPKFHGSRGKLETPLRAILAWCVDPDADVAIEPDPETPFLLPMTAERVRRMLAELETDGFTAFG